MKKAILIAVSIIIIFSGCKGNSFGVRPSATQGSKPMLSTDIPTSAPSDNEDTSVTELNILYLYADKNVMAVDQLSWQEYITEKLGITISISYKDEYPDFIRYYNFYQSNERHRGKYRILSNYDLEKTIDLTPYYTKYEWYDYVPESYISALTYEGKIIGVPAVYDKYIIPRYYNSAYLEKLELDVPTTVNEFYEFLKGAKRINSGSGVYYPMVISHYYLTQSTADLFRAYGVYVNSDYISFSAYDPNTGTFECGVFSEGIEEALEFIRSLQKEDLLAVKGSSSGQINGTYVYDQFISTLEQPMESIATEYNFIYGKPFESWIHIFGRHSFMETVYEKSNGYFLGSSNQPNTCEVRSELALYFFPSAMNNEDGVIKLFNEVMTDNDLYGDLRFGIEGNDYEMGDQGAVPTSSRTLTQRGICQILPKEDFVLSKAPGTLSILDNLNESNYYEASIFTDLFTYCTSSEFGYLANHSATEQVFYHSVSPADAIEEYKKNFRLAGIPDMLSSMNEKLGKTSQYDYYN